MPTIANGSLGEDTSWVARVVSHDCVVPDGVIA